MKRKEISTYQLINILMYVAFYSRERISQLTNRQISRSFIIIVVIEKYAEKQSLEGFYLDKSLFGDVARTEFLLFPFEELRNRRLY